MSDVSFVFDQNLK